MMTDLIRILILEDNPDDLFMVLRALKQSEIAFDYVHATDERSFQQLLGPEINVILSDYALPGYSAVEAFRHVQTEGYDIPFIVVTGAISEEVAVECMRIGMADYLLKDRLPRLGGAVENALAQAEARRAAERYQADLERSNQELEQMAYILSHDLKEPLRMVNAYAQLIQERYANQLDEDAEEFFGFMLGGVERMNALIDDLLEYSRVSSRAKPLTHTDLNQVLAGVLGNLQVLIQETDATIHHEPLPNLPADATQIGQVFQNLVTNALIFRSPERRPVVHISACPQENKMRICVEDNGIGIEDNHTDRIFDMFQRLHPHDAYPGTGIGLALAKKIVERHGGRIWVESTPGQGSQFYFTLPTPPNGGGVHRS